MSPSKSHEEKIEEIQHELHQLYQRQLSLRVLRIKAHQQQSFLYRWFQQQDPELENVNAQIEDLKQEKKELYKVLQVGHEILNLLECCVRFSRCSREGWVIISILLKIPGRVGSCDSYRTTHHRCCCDGCTRIHHLKHVQSPPSVQTLALYPWY